MPHRRIGFPDNRSVLAIQISSRQRTPVIPDNHSVRIQHGNELENELFPELPGLSGIAREEIQETFHHPGGRGFARVHSTGYHDGFLSLEEKGFITNTYFIYFAVL